MVLFVDLLNQSVTVKPLNFLQSLRECNHFANIDPYLDDLYKVQLPTERFSTASPSAAWKESNFKLMLVTNLMVVTEVWSSWVACLWNRTWSSHISNHNEHIRTQFLVILQHLNIQHRHAVHYSIMYSSTTNSMTRKTSMKKKIPPRKQTGLLMEGGRNFACRPSSL